MFKPALTDDGRGNDALDEMNDETTTLIKECPHCNTKLVIKNRLVLEGQNFSGGWIIQCSKRSCKRNYEIRIEIGVWDSWVISGGRILAAYSDGHKNRSEILRKFGLRDGR